VVVPVVAAPRSATSASALAPNHTRSASHNNDIGMFRIVLILAIGLSAAVGSRVKIVKKITKCNVSQQRQSLSKCQSALAGTAFCARPCKFWTITFLQFNVSLNMKMIMRRWFGEARSETTELFP